MTFPATTLRLLSGILIWAAHFLVIYAMTGIICARANWIELLPWGIGAASAIAVAGVLAIIFVSLREIRGATEPSRFLRWLTTAFAMLALIAIIWEALPVVMVPICV
ncbi:MAG: hypothetical protein ACREV0_01530 [Burkholderiales bacterium]